MTMTRKEEIHNAAMEVSGRWKRSELLPTQDEIIAYDSAVTMAEWCDSNPREGLWDANKVVKWILENADKHIWYDETENECGITDDFIEDLQEAMRNNTEN